MRDKAKTLSVNRGSGNLLLCPLTSDNVVCQEKQRAHLLIGRYQTVDLPAEMAEKKKKDE